MPEERGPSEGEGRKPSGWNPADRLRSELHRLERLIDPGIDLIEQAGERYVLPAWQRVTQGEPRWPVSIAIVASIGYSWLSQRKLLSARGGSCPRYRASC